MPCKDFKQRSMLRSSLKVIMTAEMGVIVNRKALRSFFRVFIESKIVKKCFSQILFPAENAEIYAEKGEK
jgi:hypothetical protein